MLRSWPDIAGEDACGSKSELLDNTRLFLRV